MVLLEERTLNKRTRFKFMSAFVPVAADGHCLFSAFAYGWSRTIGVTHVAALKMSREEHIKMYFRRKAVEYVCRDRELRTMKQAVLEGVDDHGIVDLETYREHMPTRSECWGDDIEMVALMRRFRRHIVLWDTRSETLTLRQSPSLPADVIVPESLVFLHYDGVHYSALDPDELLGEFRRRRVRGSTSASATLTRI